MVTAELTLGRFNWSYQANFFLTGGCRQRASGLRSSADEVGPFGVLSSRS